MRTRLARLVPPALSLVLFTVALAALHRALREYSYRDVVSDLRAIPAARLGWAVALTIINYVALTLYDVLALRYIRRPLAYRRTALASFVGYAFGQVGFPLLVGGAARYRLYSTWGLTAGEVTQMVLFNGVTLWSGVLLLSGAAFLLAPSAVFFHMPSAPLRALGGAMLLVLAAYVALTFLRSRPVRVRDWELTLPSPALASMQIGVSAIDWALAASVLYMLLPAGIGASFWHFLGGFLAGQVAGMVSHVPGGLGVFESVVILLFPGTPPSTLLSHLLAYRAVYYVLPLAAAAGSLAVYELAKRREHVRDLARRVGEFYPAIAPSLLAVTTFAGGLVLLVSGATPAVPMRLMFLKDFMPLPVMELSHFLGSIVGMGLLMLARGIQRRLDSAYHMTTLLLVAGMFLSLLKGFDYEEAAVLATMLLLLLPCRDQFYRKGSLISEGVSAESLTAVGVVLIGSVWLGFFAFKHVEYRNELWWQFELQGDAPRFLRATVGVVAAMLLFGIARLLRPSPPDRVTPPEEAADRLRAIIAESGDADANLVFLGDKSVLLSESGSGFVMYAVSGRSWVALGDPVGTESDKADLAWRFRELSDRHGGWTVFYEVAPRCLPIYLDLGLTLVKIGEEARVRLDAFSLDGKDRKKFRHAVNKVEREGCTCEIVPPDSVPALLPTMRGISDAWLADKNTREKRFSIGYFDDRYLTSFPAAIVRKGDEVLAFANVLTGGRELSIDLMRYRSGGPENLMEYLFVQLMLWGKSHGFEWFNLGMAPLSGLAEHSLAPLWNRVATLLYRQGEHFYNFQGLRQYKEKFDPEWEPRYLAAPGGLALPRILLGVTTLISGGLRGVVAK